MDEEDYYVEITSSDGSNPHRFRFKGGPLAHPNIAGEAFEAYGFAAACWARLEVHIEAMVFLVNRKENSTDEMNIFEPHHPRSVRDKIKLLRRYYNKHTALAAQKAEADSLFGRMLETALDRNDALHSIVEDFQEGCLIINGIFSKPDTTMNMRRTSMPIRNFGVLARTINDYNQELSILSKTLFTPEMTERLQMRR
jgi:hypothetical protein